MGFNNNALNCDSKSSEHVMYCGVNVLNVNSTSVICVCLIHTHKYVLNVYYTEYLPTSCSLGATGFVLQTKCNHLLIKYLSFCNMCLLFLNLLCYCFSLKRVCILYVWCICVCEIVWLSTLSIWLLRYFMICGLPFLNAVIW